MSCPHFTTYFSSEKNIEKLKVLYKSFVKPSSRNDCLTKALLCLCSICQEHSPRLHVCFFCLFFGCYDTGHIQDHAKNERHLLALDVNHGRLFCFECNDYVYWYNTMQAVEPLNDAWRKNLKMDHLLAPWTPEQSDMELFASCVKKIKYEGTSWIGLRGLYNLGNTCFMNCIIQTLMHTPLLRNYFFSDPHECFIGENCLVCEISDLFRQFFSGEKTPINLSKILHIIWNQVHHLAGYEQKDAHEFFIAVLDVMHRHCQSKGSEPHNLYPKQCTCIIDKVFTGRLRSDIICQSCKNVSSTVDPFWDISLDIGTEPHSLVDCLQRFTTPEHLKNVKCSNCNSYQESTKQLTMQVLPLVASFHLKRLEHSSQTQTRKKIVTQIAFPAELDMSPFVSHARNNPRMESSQSNLYSLYAVTNHMGSTDCGHYTAYVKHHREEWFKCDDHQITRATLSDVLASEGYQLFYHKQTIQYESQ